MNPAQVRIKIGTLVSEVLQRNTGTLPVETRRDILESIRLWGQYPGLRITKVVVGKDLKTRVECTYPIRGRAGWYEDVSMVVTPHGYMIGKCLQLQKEVV